MKKPRTKSPTNAQMEANRRNAAKSTGPKTPEGKAASSRNALRHGLCAEKHVVFDEDPQEFLALLDDLHQHFRPIGLSEEKIVNRIAAVQWRLDRTLSLETAIYANSVAEVTTADNVAEGKAERQREHRLLIMNVPLPSELPDYDAQYRMARAFTQGSSSLASLARYEASLERSFDRSTRQLKLLQTARLANASTPPVEDRAPHSQTNPNPEPAVPAAPSAPPAAPPQVDCERNPNSPLRHTQNYTFVAPPETPVPPAGAPPSGNPV